MKKTSILLVDDHAVVRMGLSAIINLQADLKVCGEAENGEAAVRLAAELKPDVVVMDFSLPGMDGVVDNRLYGLCMGFWHLHLVRS